MASTHPNSLLRKIRMAAGFAGSARKPVKNTARQTQNTTQRTIAATIARNSTLFAVAREKTALRALASAPLRSGVPPLDLSYLWTKQSVASSSPPTPPPESIDSISESTGFFTPPEFPDQSAVALCR
ncbi:uncharacterized protein EI90DRAFT_3015649 [Cantharellus anzutake]|uniref:uncharacterized protein n=1 Tax=Cantharellus anzutake TaxID=1750568 RepID=UPI0019053104|nr:uncharacterized protein EI90DRAFT_3015649 [Cantharellus anzutake]KAF8333247.1 hypothetical protein EI90DRAFT_3015649 [Cantharellus anzutake]